MQKSICKLTTFVFLMTMLTSCGIDMLNRIEGNNNVVIQKRELIDFTKVKVSNGIELIIQQDDSISLIVEADENLHENIITEVIDGTLKIWSKKNIWRATSKKVHLTLNTLEALTASSGSSVVSKNTIKAEDFEVSSSSGANLNMKLETNRLVSSSSSGSKLGMEILATHVESSSSSGSNSKIIGETITHKANASSGSSLNAFGLKAKDVNARVSSGASVRVYVTESINASASSGGSIRYQGNPTQVSKETSSGGGVSSE